MPPRVVLLRACIALLMLWTNLSAQEFREESTSYTAWVDLNRLVAKRVVPEPLPIWLESVKLESTGLRDGSTDTVIRLRLRELQKLDKEMQLRLFFEDHAGRAPQVSGWSDDGTKRFARGPLGQDLGLPTSESLTFPTTGVDYVEIRAAGDGTNLRGVFLAVLKNQKVVHALDFDSPTDFVDPFGQSGSLKLAAEDTALFGRVKAALDRGTMKLTPEDAPLGIWEFELQTVPLHALVTFEVLNADGEAPLELIINDRPLGPVSVQWPDLADPGYFGVVRPLEGGMRFRYTGWLRVQKIIPGSALQVGVNRLVLQVHSESGPLAVRTLELQLKHNSKNLDYTLAPSAP